MAKRAQSPVMAPLPEYGAAKMTPEELEQVEQEMMGKFDINEPGDDLLPELDDDEDGNKDGNNAGDNPSDDNSGDTPAGPDEALVLRARHAGLSEQEIELFDAEGLAKAVAEIEGVDDRRQAAIDAAKARRAKATEPPADDDLEITLNPEEHDEEVIAQFNGMKKHFAAQTAALKAQIEQLKGVAQRAAKDEFEGKFDGFVRDLGGDWEDVLGKGGISALDRKSEQYKNRVEILAEMDALAAGYNATGRALPSQAELFKRAAHAVHGDKHKNIARNSIRQEVNSHRSSAVARPTDRQSADHSSPDDRARAFAKQFLSDAGELDEE